MADHAPDDVVVRPFADFLREIRGGGTHEELSQKLNELVTAVEDTGKPGTLTFQITVKPMEKGNTSALLVADNITVKLPVVPRKASVFFPDGGNLVRTDPNQLSFDTLRDVSRSDDGEREPDARERAAGDHR